jgi:putrescine aminotransferase
MKSNQEDSRMSKAVERTNVSEPYRDVYDYTQQVLDLIAKEEITEEEAAWVTRQTVDNFRDHVNPGFLGYRKSVTKDGQFAAVEWKDAGPNSFMDVNGKVYIDCLGGFGIYNVGHRHPKVVEAVISQLNRQPLHSQDLLDPLRAMLA